MGTLVGRSMTETMSVMAPAGRTSGGTSMTWSIDSFTIVRCGMSCFATTTFTRVSCMACSRALFSFALGSAKNTARPRRMLAPAAIMIHWR